MPTSTTLRTDKKLALYLVTDRSGIELERFYHIIEEAIAGGVTCVQLREKTASDEEILAIGAELLKRLRPKGIPLIINDRVDLALALGANGVHLGQTDGCAKDARKRLGPNAILGQSLENFNQAVAARDLPLDYIVASPVFATPTKTDTNTPWGLEGINILRSIAKAPLLAIGGINATNAKSILDAGAQGLCVVSAIMNAADPRICAQQLKTIISQSS